MKKIKRKRLGFEDLTEKWQMIVFAAISVPAIGWALAGIWLLHLILTR